MELYDDLVLITLHKGGADFVTEGGVQKKIQ